MKKIKLVTISAVALLSVAPVVTAALPVNNAQASLLSDVFTNPTDIAEQTSNATAAINGLTDETYNESNPMPDVGQFAGLVGLSENGRGLSPVSFSAEIAHLNSGMTDAATTALANTKVQKLKVYVQANGLRAGVKKASEKGNGNKFSFTVVMKNGENTIASKTVTYTNNTKMATDDDTSTTTPTNPTTPSTGLTDITDLQGHNVINLAGPSGFVYSLFSAAGKKSNRGLAGETSWFTDKSAKDANGTTYYRVSTDEWVALSSGVTLQTN